MTKRLSHAGDPWTSADAAIQLGPEARATLKDALITLLAEKPRTDDELVAAYTSHAETNRWPLLADLHSVKRRRSELHTIHHVVQPTGETRPSRMGRKSVVWELAVPEEHARIIVAMRGAV